MKSFKEFIMRWSICTNTKTDEYHLVEYPGNGRSRIACGDQDIECKLDSSPLESKERRILLHGSTRRSDKLNDDTARFEAAHIGREFCGRCAATLYGNFK